MPPPTGAPSSPGLTVVLATRGGADKVAPVVAALLPQLEAVDGELVVVSARARDPAPPDRVRWIVTGDTNLLELRRTGIEAARGPVVAIAEDHAVPTSTWCEAIVRAHAEHPEAAAVMGCLVNATDATVCGRANFSSFAAPFAPPMPTLPGRPPPISALSFKRSDLEPIRGDTNVGAFESVLVPSLFEEGRMVADDRILVDHYQDNGLWWSIRNAFVNTKANYGYANDGAGTDERLTLARWLVRHLFLRQWREAWSRQSVVEHPGEAPVVALLCAATALGAVMGTVVGPGRAAERVA